MDNTQKVLHYFANTQGPVTEETGDAPMGRGRQSTKPLHWGAVAMKGLRWAVLMICLGVWAVVGAVFWIPLLLRRVIAYSAALVPAMLAGTRPHQAAKGLRHAMDFYRRGFQVTTEIVSGEPDRSESAGAKKQDTRLGGMALLNELAWVAVTWYAVLYLLGAIVTSPLDMWWWVEGISWTDSVFGPINDFMKSLMHLQ